MLQKTQATSYIFYLEYVYFIMPWNVWPTYLAIMQDLTSSINILKVQQVTVRRVKSALVNETSLNTLFKRPKINLLKNMLQITQKSIHLEFM